MKPAAFEHHAPEELDDVVGLLAEHGDEAKVLAGGQSLVPMLALRLTRFDHLIDVNRVPELSGLRRDDGWLRVGATTRHRVLELDPEVATAVPLLARATRHVGHFQIRNRGTLGGAVAHADPAAEHPAVALALDAVMEVASTAGRREIPAADFFEGTWSTAMAPDEVLTAVRFPVWDGRCGFAVEEVARRHGDFALVGVLCGVSLDNGNDRRPGDGDAADGSVRRAAIAFFGVGSTPVRSRAAEEALVAGATLTDVAAAAMAGLHPSDDLHVSGAYRQKVAGVLVRRALARAIKEAQGA
jgi:aerobic carbon-monoxide dehydrogenase medium subunit